MNDSERPDEAINKKRAPLWWRLLGVFVRTVEVLFVAGIIYMIYFIVETNATMWGRNSPATRAFAEIKGMELAMLKICADAHVTSVRELFADDADFDAGTPQEILDRHTEWMYSIFRKDNLSEVPLTPEARKLVGEFHMDIGNDPWKKLYVFYIPLSSGISETPIGALLDATYKEQGEIANRRESVTVAIISTGKNGRPEFSLGPPVFREKRAVSPKNKDDITNLRPDYDFAAYN